MKFLLLIVLLINICFANSQNISRMNALKNVIQKEEYIALAINKYILQTGSLPLTTSNTFDWAKLEVEEYLGENFNRNNPITSKDINVDYNTTSYNFFIKGVVDDIEEPKFLYNDKLKYLYNFYASRIFRVNTLAPVDTTVEKLKIGSQVLYSSIQKEIVNILNFPSPKINTIKLDSQECTLYAYYYELKGKKLTYKYCKSIDNPVTVYQDSPIYVEDSTELQYIKAKIGDKAYAKKNGRWFEYYYQGDTNPPWVAVYLGSNINAASENQDVEELILNYIPKAKDLVFRRDGGCMLANGDIFCWGNNKYKKAGIENYGQLDKSLTPDYVNTPVMLKVQIDNITKMNDNKGILLSRQDKIWYNNPYRVKFEKMSMNSTNVCGISPIIPYKVDGITKIYGGDLFCNGSVSSTYFEDLEENINMTSILKKNKFFTKGKTNTETSSPIYLQDIVMVEDTGVVLSDAGDIYTFGRNYKGALGIGSDDKFIIANTPEKINGDTIFKKIFALRDIKGLGAIDEHHQFWIWGERPDGTVYNKPTLLAGSLKFNKDAIFVNTNEFVLKGVDNKFYKTTGPNSIISLSPDTIPSSAISVSIFDGFYTYVNKDLELKASANLLKCMKPNETEECSSAINKTIFTLALDELNKKSTTTNGKDFANFANVSIFKLDSVIEEKFEDFQTGAVGWFKDGVAAQVDSSIPDNGDDTQIPFTSFLGRFAISTQDEVYPAGAVRDGVSIAGTPKGGIPTIVTKEFSFPGYPDYELELEFDFYEIGTWDGERFEVWANGKLLSSDHFVMDGQEFVEDSNITGENLQDNIISDNDKYHGDQRYRYKLRTKLDSNAKVEIKFKTTLISDGPYYFVEKDEVTVENHWAKDHEDGSNESWGIDNVRVKLKETSKKFVCAMTGFKSESQMYCWGNVARSIPILSTSLYDMSKISNINKLFITQENEKKNQMSYGPHNSKGNLFLKFPTYIGGFDYEFYFK